MDASKSDIESLMEAIMQLVRDANRLAAESLEYTRIQVLRLVLARGPTSMIDIATALDMAPSAVVRNLRALEEQEMVSVVEGSGTAGGGATGCLVATVTPAGIEEVRQVADAGSDMLAAVTNDWSGDDVRGLCGLLTRLSEAYRAFQQASARKVSGPA